MDSLTTECVKIIQDGEDSELRLNQEVRRKAQAEAYQKSLDAFNREYTILYAAGVYKQLCDGSWIKRCDLLVTEGKDGKKASIDARDIDVDQEIVTLQDYIVGLKASLLHLKKAKELIDA